LVPWEPVYTKKKSRRQKMHKKQDIKRFIILSILGFIILGGCAKPPTEEMEAATEALIRAENDPDAAAFGETSLNRARDAIFRMRQEANLKRYDAAKAYANEAISAAEKAISDGRAAAQRAREEASGLLSTVKDSLTETQGLLSHAKGNGLTLDYEALDQGVEDAEGAINQAESVVTSQPREALEKGQSARAALSDIRGQISQGAREASSKK
jgi:F0F1-type ATP synthase membrane subunit b/b'